MYLNMFLNVLVIFLKGKIFLIESIIIDNINFQVYNSDLILVYITMII